MSRIRHPARSSRGTTSMWSRKLGACAVIGGAVFLGAAPGASGAVSCPDVDAPPGAVGIERSATAIVCLVDHERTAAGLGTVSINAQVRTAAQGHAEDMATRGYFAHESPEGGDPGTRLLLSGFVWSTYGENIAAGQQTPREVMEAWLASPPHCRTLMTPRFTVAGYGIALASTGPYWVQNFARPVLFGPTMVEQEAPSCPRPPTPFGGTAPATGVRTAVATTSPTTTTTPRVRVTARRTGRRLRVAIVLLGADGRTYATAVRVRQRGRTVRTRKLRRSARTTQRLTIGLPAAARGQVRVTTGGARTVTANFR